MPPAPNARALAARAVHGVLHEGVSLDRSLGDAAPADADRALVAELVYGTLRRYFSLRAAVVACLTDPKKPLEAMVESLLLVGAYQLQHTRVPQYAAVSATVDAVTELDVPWARGLVNAVLRNLVRRSTAPHDRQNARTTDEARYDQPHWLIERVRREYPATAERLLEVCNERAPMSLRVNRKHLSRDDYRAQLAAVGITATPGLTPDALRLDTPVSVARLPGFDRGLVSVQDEGAQLAAELLGGAGRLLDACAAPGGKAFHALEGCPQRQVVALDVDKKRCDGMRAECSRLDIDAAFIVCGDALGLTWWDGVPFDSVLVDAPCSGTGTLRRHPDIRLLKNEADLPRFHELQYRLIANLWPLLAPGGTMLYCTCSILAIENDAVIGRFLDKTPHATAVPIDAAWGAATLHGRQLLPASSGPDGFYYARLSKLSSKPAR